MGEPSDIFVLGTGGTYDMYYRKGKGSKLGFRPESGLDAALAKFGNPDFFEVEHLPPVDSEFMKDDYREDIWEKCLAAVERGITRIVIIHGSDTALKTAEYLASRLRVEQQVDVAEVVIVITCASTPEIQKDTDADLNLGGAVIAVQMCKPGVHFVVNAQVFDWHNCQKNDDGTFSALGD